MAPRTRRPDGPAISADVVALVVAEAHPLRVLLSPRQFEPDRGALALPGVLILAGETVVEACHRALATKSGIGPELVRSLRMAWLADSPVRDTRGHTISVAYLAVVDGSGLGDDGSNVLVRLDEIPAGLPFDHNVLIERALDRAREWLWADDGALARDLLGDRFTGAAAAALLGQLDPGFNTTNTPRLLASKPFLAKAAKAKPAGPGRPPVVWEFTGASSGR